MAKRLRPWLGWVYLIALTIGLLTAVALIQSDARAAKKKLQMTEKLCIAAHQQIDLLSNWGLKRIRTGELDPQDRLALERQLGSEWHFGQALRDSPSMRFERALSARRGAAIAAVLGRRAESLDLNAASREIMKSLIVDNPTVECYYLVLVENYLAGAIQHQSEPQQAMNMLADAAALIESDTFPRHALATRSLLKPLTNLTAISQQLSSPATAKLSAQLRSAFVQMQPYAGADPQLDSQLEDAESVLGRLSGRS